MAKYRFSSDAQADLANLRHYTLKNWGSQQSKKYLSGLKQTIILLAKSPEMGKKRPDVSAGTLSFLYASHVIYYLVGKEYLFIYAVLHKGMVPNSHLEHRA